MPFKYFLLDSNLLKQRNLGLVRLLSEINLMLELRNFMEDKVTSGKEGRKNEGE